MQNQPSSRHPRFFYPRLATIAALTFVLLLAALMRIYHLNHQSLWFDEAFAWNIVQQHDMYPRIAADTHPPLYYVLLRGWIGVAGDSAVSMRYLSALTSMLTVALVVQIGRELVRGRRWTGAALWSVPIMAGLLMALTDADIDLAQEARNYALYTCLSCLSMGLYLRWIRTQRGLWLPAAWVIANTALVYTHYQGVFIPAIQGLHALLFLRGRKRLDAVGLLASSGLLLAPWLLFVTIPQAEHAITNDIPYSIPSNWDTVLHLRREFFTMQWPLMLVLVALGLVNLNPQKLNRQDAENAKKTDINEAGAHTGAPLQTSDHLEGAAKKNPFSFLLSSFSFTQSYMLLAAAWLLIPLIVLFVGNYFAPLLTERKLAIITPAIALLIAFGLANLRQPATSLLLIAIVLYGLIYVDSYRLKEPWDDVAAEAVRYAEPYDIALIEMGNGQYPMKYYWEHEMPEGVFISTFPVLGDPTMSVTTDWPTYYDLWLPQVFDYNREHQIGPVATAWLAYWYREHPSIDRLEQAGYVRTMSITHQHLGNNLDLYRYDLLPAEPVTTFDGGLTLRAAEIDADKLRIDLWWSADAPLTTEYVTKAFLLDGNGVQVAQLDSVPFLGQRSTLSWQPGEVIYDPKDLQLANGLTDLPPGTYTVAVQVYSFADGGIVVSQTADGQDWITVGTIER